MTEYISLNPLTQLQADIMQYVDMWARLKRVPVPRNKIIEAMTGLSYNKYAIKYSLEKLKETHYLREAIHTADDALNKTSYVQLRRI